jgi:hypothetical protein
MVANRQLTSEQDAIKELIIQSAMHPDIVYPAHVGKMIGYMLTMEMLQAKMIWELTLRNRMLCTSVDMLTLQEIDGMFEEDE